MSLQTTVAKLIYVGCVTFFVTCLGCWGLLAHQEALPSGRHAGDDQFAREAAQGGMAEVALGHLAEERAGNSNVKAFAERMIVQHSRANDQLKQTAAKAGWVFPSDLSARDRSTQDRLSKLSGEEFDRAYAREMVDDHQRDLVAFQREANVGKNSDVKEFAQQALPMLREHLNQARDLLKSVAAARQPAPKRNARTSAGR